MHNERVKLYLMANNCEYETNAYKIYSLLTEDEDIVQKNNNEPRLSPDFMYANKDLICNEKNMTDQDIKKYPLAVNLRMCIQLSLTDSFYKDFLCRFISIRAYKDNQFEMVMLYNGILLDDGNLIYKSIPSITEILAMKTFDLTLFKYFINMLIEIIAEQANNSLDYVLVRNSALILLNIIYNILFNDEIVDFCKYISDRDRNYPFDATKYSTVSDSINSSDFKWEETTKTKINFILDAFKSAAHCGYSDSNKILGSISKVLQHASLNIFESDSVETYFCKSYIQDNHQTYYDTGIRKERKTNDQ